MYKYILQTVEGVNWLAMICLLLFFLFFTSNVVWAFLKKREEIDEMARMPLDN